MFSRQSGEVNFSIGISCKQHVERTAYHVDCLFSSTHVKSSFDVVIRCTRGVFLVNVFFARAKNQTIFFRLCNWPNPSTSTPQLEIRRGQKKKVPKGIGSQSSHNSICQKFSKDPCNPTAHHKRIQGVQVFSRITFGTLTTSALCGIHPLRSCWWKKSGLNMWNVKKLQWMGDELPTSTGDRRISEPLRVFGLKPNALNMWKHFNMKISRTEFPVYMETRQRQRNCDIQLLQNVTCHSFSDRDRYHEPWWEHLNSNSSSNFQGDEKCEWRDYHSLTPQLHTGIHSPVVLPFRIWSLFPKSYLEAIILPLDNGTIVRATEGLFDSSSGVSLKRVPQRGMGSPKFITWKSPQKLTYRIRLLELVFVEISGWISGPLNPCWR